MKQVRCMTTRSYRMLPVRGCFGGLFAVLLCLVAGNGCVTPTYQATELPPEYAAKPVDKLNRADLSRLTSHSVRSSQIGIGDLLEVAVYSGYGDDRTEPNKVNVAADGTADIPLIGPVQVNGMTPEESQYAIAEAARQRDVIRTPYVSVRVEEQRRVKVAVSGAVIEPSVVELPQGNSTLLNAILAAGGLAEDASPEVTIRRPVLAANAPDALRGNPLRLAGGGDSVVLASYEEETPSGDEATTFEINLVSATEEGTGVHLLADGDVVHVKRRPDRKIRVGGLVKIPGEIDIPPDEDIYLVEALTMAGDHTIQTADSVVVLRRVPGTPEPVTIKASIREAKRNEGNILLQANDVVIVEETPVTIAIETLKTFFRFSVGSSLALF